MHKDENISLTAAELYIKMARAKACDDDHILKHVLEFYLEETVPNTYNTRNSY